MLRLRLRLRCRLRLRFRLRLHIRLHLRFRLRLRLPQQKYTTLGPTFYAKLVSAITRRKMNENQRFLGESPQNFT